MATKKYISESALKETPKQKLSLTIVDGAIGSNHLKPELSSKIAMGTTAYRKPALGIPASDLSVSVQSSLALANTAAQKSDTYTKAEVKALIPVFKENDVLYTERDNNIYPVSHPDLSTQPSILPQRFGNLEIKEVLIAPGRENEIPSDAIIIEASSFNKDACVPAVCKKVDGRWMFANCLYIEPDYTLVRYYGHDNSYYGSGSDSGRTVIRTYLLPRGNTTLIDISTSSLWGNEHQMFNQGVIVGYVGLSSSSYNFPLKVLNVGSSITCTFDNNTLHIGRGAGGNSSIDFPLSYDATFNFYAV